MVDRGSSIKIRWVKTNIVNSPGRIGLSNRYEIDVEPRKFVDFLDKNPRDSTSRDSSHRWKIDMSFHSVYSFIALETINH